MKLSIVILCWNDLKVIGDCLRSIYATTHSTDFEVIVSDNGSTDGSPEYIHREFPQTQVIENGRNLRFAKGNNVAIRASRGEYVLILNPDTIIQEGTLDGIVQYADQHPEAGAFGCQVVFPDGTYQPVQRPINTIRSEWCWALGLRALGRFSEWFQAGSYENWHGETERTVGWLAGCFILVRGELLKRLGGFDEQFFYYYEDTDLCRRIWQSGASIRFTPKYTIVHLGGQSTVNRFSRLTFALDAEVTRYLYYYKYNGLRGIQSCRAASLVGLLLRRLAYGLLQIVRPSEENENRLELFRTLFDWNYKVDLLRLVQNGEEPELKIKLADRVMER
jgi:N-acetylglucosaminyl-diphospho-decaprenol L-rhamnosyltransferase